jgi:exosortase/archaeosortase family protein
VSPALTPPGAGSVSVRLAVALVGATGLMLAMEQWPQWQHFFDPVTNGLARVTELVLRCLQVPVARHGNVLAHPDGFSYRIDYACSGLRPATLLLVTLLALPATWSARLIGFCVAAAGIEALNLLRLVHLYWIGVANPDAFYLAHRVIWNAIAVAAVSVFLLAWLAINGVNRAPRERVRQL